MLNRFDALNEETRGAARDSNYASRGKGYSGDNGQDNQKSLVDRYIESKYYILKLQLPFFCLFKQ